MFRTFIRAAALLVIVMPAAPLAAQTPASPELVTACVQSQQQVMLAADAANRRLELARQTNQAAAMRAAMDDLQGVLSSMRTQLAPCATLQAAAAPAAQDMANMPGHTMPAAAPAAQARPAAPGARAPGGAADALRPVTPSAAAPAANRMVMVQTAFDPTKLTCTPKVDPGAAAKTTYQGKTYYFCSAKDRDEFLTNPTMSLSMMPPKQ